MLVSLDFGMDHYCKIIYRHKAKKPHTKNPDLTQLNISFKINKFGPKQKINKQQIEENYLNTCQMEKHSKLKKQKSYNKRKRKKKEKKKAVIVPKWINDFAGNICFDCSHLL